MDRRSFLSLGAGAVISLSPKYAVACATQTACNPDVPDNYRGSRTGTPPLRPKLCLSDEIYDYMSLTRDGRRITPQWDYGLYYGNGRQPEVYQTLVTGRCYDRQGLWPSTRIINWVNCINRSTGMWQRVWSSTRPIVDNGTYELVRYRIEPATGYEDQPRRWPLPA